MNRERLQLMATLLREVAADPVKSRHFRLDAWVGQRRGAYSYKGIGLDAMPEGMAQVREDGCVIVDVTRECGYAACACGWAGSDPRFIAQGFCLNGYASGYVLPVYHPAHEYGWSAICAFFDIDRMRAHNLFDADNYAEADSSSPLAVASRIEAYVAAGAA